MIPGAPPEGSPKMESKGGRLAPGRSSAPAPPGPPWTRLDKPRNVKNALRELYTYLGRYKIPLAIGVALAILASAVSVVGPQFLKDISNVIYDGITGHSMDTGRIFQLALIIVALYSINIVFSTLEHYIVPVTSERVANHLRSDLSRKINRLPLNYYDNSSTGDIMSRLTNDADTVGDSCGTTLSVLMSAVTTFVGSIVMMFYTNVTLAVITMIPPILGFLFTRYVMSHTHRYFVKQSCDLGAMNGHVEEVYYGHDIVRAYNGEEKSRERFVEINDDLYHSSYKARFISSTMPQVMNLVSNMGYVIVCIVGSMLVIRGEITYGVIVAFIVYVKMFSNPLLMISDALASMQSLAASSERVFDLLNAPEMDDESTKDIDVKDVRGEIEFRDVSFSYIEGLEIIHHFSLHVNPGEKIAIVGPTGAGKTTVVNLLMRFYELDSGDIVIDGNSTKSLRREQVHSMFSMVLQDAWLFNGTVRENLVFNKEGVTDEQVFEACRSVGIHDFITALPQGYDTRLSDASGISAGQKQQIAIARAIIHEAPMIIFDEATSSVDTRTEKQIQKAMDKLTEGRTSFIIAHRLSTIKNCDKIIVMRDGRIMEAGTHQELLAKGGFYAELYNSQFENCA